MEYSQNHRCLHVVVVLMEILRKTVSKTERASKLVSELRVNLCLDLEHLADTRVMDKRLYKVLEYSSSEKKAAQAGRNRWRSGDALQHLSAASLLIVENSINFQEDILPSLHLHYTQGWGWNTTCSMCTIYTLGKKVKFCNRDRSHYGNF